MEDHVVCDRRWSIILRAWTMAMVGVFNQINSQLIFHSLTQESGSPTWNVSGGGFIEMSRINVRNCQKTKPRKMFINMISESRSTVNSCSLYYIQVTNTSVHSHQCCQLYEKSVRSHFPSLVDLQCYVLVCYSSTLWSKRSPFESG